MADISERTRIKMDIARFSGIIVALIGSTWYVSNQIHEAKLETANLRRDVAGLRTDLDSLRDTVSFKVTPLTLKVYSDKLKQRNPSIDVPDLTEVLLEANALEANRRPR